MDPVLSAHLGVKVSEVSKVGSTRRRRGATFLHMETIGTFTQR